ncbi:MAG TPA: helix-turn-helix transcriptional regulator [Thermoanaerobaculia bacterium]|nr:helix-turn-helix transcriptional regulator [Thermoanaerobaculia bacterium]
MIGVRIREARLAQSRSLADVAGKAKISVATLSRVENDKQSVDLALFITLARVLHVPANDLLGDEAGGSSEPLARRISTLPPRQRQELWCDLAAEARARRSTRRGGNMREIGQQVEELLAQMEFLREELEAVRKRVKKR